MRLMGRIPVSYTTHDSEGWHSGTSYESYHVPAIISHEQIDPPEKPTKAWDPLAFFTFIAFMISPCLGFIGLAGVVGVFDPETNSTTSAKLVMCLVVFIGAIMYGLLLFGLWRFYVSADKPLGAKHAENIIAWSIPYQNGKNYIIVRETIVSLFLEKVLLIQSLI